MKASAVVDGLAASASQSVAVNAGPVTANLSDSSTAPVLATGATSAKTRQE